MKIFLKTKLMNDIKAHATETEKELLESHLNNININGRKTGCSGFIKLNKGLVYVNTEKSCARSLEGKLMFRTATHLKDWTGGTNRYVDEKVFAREVLRLLREQNHLGKEFC